ncbi:MAG: hypothetical protein ACTS77_03945 [Arsenophonus sp. NC-TX2-MAG3]
MAKIFPDIQDKHCWTYKTANIFSSHPNRMKLKVNGELQEIYLAESYDATNKFLDILLVMDFSKHPAEMKKLEKI